MNIPQMSGGSASRDMLAEFRGYNHNKSIEDNQFYDMKNISSRNYPCMSPRKRRGAINISSDSESESAGNVLGMLAKDELYWIQGDAENKPTALYKNNIVIASADPLTGDNHLKWNVAGRRQMVSMGGQLVIFPDNVLFNPNGGTFTYLGADAGAHGSGGTNPVNSAFPIVISISRQDGGIYLEKKIANTNEASGNTYVGPDTPKTQKNDNGEISFAPQNGEYWIDTSGEKSVLKSYSDSLGVWSPVASTFVKIQHEMFLNGTEPLFKTGDAVTLAGFKDKQFNTTMYVYSSGVDTIAGAGGSNRTVGWIVVTGIIDSVEINDYIGVTALSERPEAVTASSATNIYVDGTYYRKNANGTEYDAVTDAEEISILQQELARTISAERVIPDMDFVVESKNRLWGCKYGFVNGEPVNEIYACKLGDPTNWYCYQGIASDSYAVTLGTDGEFTGAVAYQDAVIFFKENYIHQIYGSKPSNYQVSFDAARGVKKGSDRSVCIVGETLYYLSKSGVMAYSGGVPVNVGTYLGNERRFTDGVAGAVGTKYYICMTDVVTNERAIYVFDIDLQQWYKEDEADVDIFVTLKENLLAAGEGNIIAMDAESYDLTVPIGGGQVMNISNAENLVEWSAETGDIGLTTPDEKYYSFLQMRFECGAESEIRISFQYDSNGKWIEKFRFRAERKRVIEVPFVSPRCDHIKIRFSGKGDFTLYSVSKYYESGGDVLHGRPSA